MQPSSFGLDLRVGGYGLLLLLLTACGGGGSGKSEFTPTAAMTADGLSPIAALGKQVFFDQSLSVSGVQSCASCHDASRAHAGNDELAVPFGGSSFVTPGFRNAPSLDYLSFNPAFYFDNEGTPTGGFDRDGRADSLKIQAERPFMAPHEMANSSSEALVAKLQKAVYSAEFRRIFGADIFARPEDVLQRATLAIAQFEQEDPSFHSFTSKFDYFLKGQANLNSQELLGLALFNNPLKGNCAGCHPSSRGADGTPPLFTDFTYDNLGVPRNFAIPATADPAYFDLGLCGPDRLDLGERSDLCGAFKVPTLRNVARTAPYFHNGVFKTLRDVVSFYVRRDTHPEEFYPLGAQGVDKFNDLPELYRVNVNTTEAPYNRGPGEHPALDSIEIDAVVAFLNTLTDGYSPQQPE